MTSEVAFPAELPPGYSWCDDEVEFDPDRHLQLGQPDEVVRLDEFGYGVSEIEPTATPVALTSPFRLLSDDGVEVMLAVARRLRQHATSAGDRIERTVRGGCYRSKWLRDLCRSPEVAEHLSGIYGVAIVPHPMALQLGHLNYEPSRVDRAIDKWHHDTLPLDYVMTVTDPRELDGGDFQYFVGTKDEAAHFATSGIPFPEDRVVTPDLPGPGWALALHGNMVVHRVTPLRRLAERISMVNGYVSLDPYTASQTRSADLIGVDDPNVVWTEWARFAAWQGSRRLTALIEDLEWTSDRAAVADALTSAIAGVRTTIDDMRDATGTTHHYGD